MCASALVLDAVPSRASSCRVLDRGTGRRRFTLVLPPDTRPDRPLGLLVALHGRGEAYDPALGARAWVDRYGLVSALDRVLAPPIAPTARRPDWTPERLAEVNTSLAASPFRGLAVACPYTPDVARAANPRAALDELGRFVLDEVVPAARALAPIASGPSAVRIDGCSMGGPLALELFLARPDAFGGVGVVQPAMGPHRAKGFADRLRAARATHHRGPVHVLTSRGDPFRDGAMALAKAVGEAGVPVALRDSPGPHDQPWLRETGSIEMLLAHERGVSP